MLEIETLRNLSYSTILMHVRSISDQRRSFKVSYILFPAKNVMKRKLFSSMKYFTKSNSESLFSVLVRDNLT